MLYPTTYTDHWNITTASPELLSPTIIHSYPGSPSYAYTPTLHYRPSTPIGPRPEGFSNINSVFAADDLFELSTTDEEDGDDDDKDDAGAMDGDFDGDQYQERGSEALRSDGKSTPGYFDHLMLASSDEEEDEGSEDDEQAVSRNEGRREQESDNASQYISTPPLVGSSGTDSDSSQEAIEDLTCERKTPVINVIGVDDEDDMMGDVSDDGSDGDDDEDYKEAVVARTAGRGKGRIQRQRSTGGRSKTSARNIIFNSNMIRPPQARYNNTLPITFVLALPPIRPKGREYRAISGHMSSYEFSLLVYAFINQMSEQKRFKSIINLDLAIYIRKCLIEGTDESVAGGNFRYWAKKMFSIAADPAGNQGDGMEGDYLVHELRRVALVEEFYGLLTRAHEQTGHGGRDKVMKQIRDRYSYLPKDLVCRFTSTCPTCHPERSRDFFNQQKFNASMDVRTEADFPPATPTPTMKRRRSLEDTEDEDEGVVIGHNYQARQQRKSNAHQNRQRKAKQTILTIQVPTAPLVRRDSDSTDSLVSIPPTPMTSVHEDITRCSSVSPISEALDVSSASTSAFVTPTLSPLLEDSNDLPIYRRPHMRVTRSSSKMTFAIDPLLDESIVEDASTTFSQAEMNHILKELSAAKYPNVNKQGHRLEQEEVDRVIALTNESILEYQATPLTEYADGLYWHQKCVFDGTAILLGSSDQAHAVQVFHDQRGPDNQLGLSITAAAGPCRSSRTEVSYPDNITNATWSKLVLVSPNATSSSSDMDRAFWKAIKLSKLVRYLGILRCDQEEDSVRDQISSRPLNQSGRPCYLYQPKPSNSNRPQHERSISDIKVTLNDLHLHTETTAFHLEPVI